MLSSILIFIIIIPGQHSPTPSSVVTAIYRQYEPSISTYSSGSVSYYYFYYYYYYYHHYYYHYYYCYCYNYYYYFYYYYCILLLTTTSTATAIIIIIITGVNGVAISAADVQWRLVEQLLTSAVDGDEVINIDCAFDTWI